MEGEGVLPKINFKLDLIYVKLKKILKSNMGIMP